MNPNITFSIKYKPDKAWNCNILSLNPQSLFPITYLQEKDDKDTT